MKTFDKAGPENTQEMLDLLRESVREYTINQVVVASTWGDTGLAVANLFHETPVRVVVVTHNVGFKDPGSHEMKPEIRTAIENLGAKVCTGTMPFRNIGTAIRATLGYSQQDLIANTLRLFGQGMKVCVEIALMASDAGLITPEDIIAVAGTGRGADTATLLLPQPSNRLFDLKIRKILAKPNDW